MCGIVSIFDSRGVDPEELRALTLTLRHRGPDGGASLALGEVGLGQARLSILDLSTAGRNPMPYRTPSGDQYWITFNGEIFNFLELRRELESVGYRFSTSTDTEVIPAAFDAWGEKCLSRFNGMWAFALWDVKRKKLFASRDRFGIKPLYYLSKDRVVISSELKSFLALNNFTPEIEEQVLPRLFERSRYDGVDSLTILRGVNSLMPGHFLIASEKGVEISRYWETKEQLVKVPPKYEEQVEAFREIFLDAVRLRLRSDVPIATSLSGGVDSSSVASSIAHLMRNNGAATLERTPQDWQRAFIASFPGTVIDEQVHAEAVANHIGAKTTVVPFNQAEALRYLVSSIWSLDEPAGGYVTPVWLLYKAMRREGVVVSLDGHGGDELLGGYAWYLDQSYETLNDSLYQEFHFKILPTILRNYDRCSMAHGIEVRIPLLDHRLVSFAFSLPPESKIGNGLTKRILRDSMAGIVPERIRTRQQKIGFNTPMVEWFNGPLLPLLERLFQSSAWQKSRYWNGITLGAQILERGRAKSWKTSDWDTLFKLSTIINFTIWQLLFIEKDPFWTESIQGFDLSKSSPKEAPWQ